VATKERMAMEALLMVADKEGNDVDFVLNKQQAILDSNLTGRDIVPKARQLGMSTYVLGRYFIKCLSKRNTRAVVISHDKESTQKMLSRVHYFKDNIKGPKAVVKNASKNELTFPKTNSAFYIGTAGSRKFGRGDTITDLHCSEVAFWPDPITLITGLFQAVPRTGEIIMESTGNGVGNYYHRMCVRAAEGKGRWRMHFFNWLDFDEYNIDLSPDERDAVITSLDEEYDEPELMKKFDLSAGQIQFRREKLEELDYNVVQFRQEYPITLDECFQSTGYSIFQKIKYEPHPDWTRMDKNLFVMIDDYKHRRSRYALGVDVSGGVGRDRSVVQIIDLIKWEQVGEWVSDSTDPEYLAYEIAKIGERYRDAYITVESNNHGAATLLVLKKIYPPSLLFRSKQDSDNLIHYGYKTSTKTKPIMLGNLRTELAQGYVVRSPLLRDELSTFVEKENGKMEAEQGCFDDRVMALAVGLMGGKRAGYLIEHESYKAQNSLIIDPFSMDSIIDELRGKYNQQEGTGDFPIPRQDLGA
jgi:hypothetical protein